MPLIKIKVERDLEQLQNRVRHLMDDVFHISRPMAFSEGGWVPAVDIYEAPNAIYVVVEAAGVDIESLHLSFEGQFLHLTGQRHSPVSLGKRRFYQMEIEYGPFERILRVPVAVDMEHIEAHYENGLLIVEMPRKESKEAIKIEVS
ncbi:MAG: Hsp20 family protein [Nitrospiraceae bacterium]|nr:Hsp20 family protein [Nitrospiraceae bacterium]